MPRADLIPDCGRCAALCCEATSFDRSEDFAFSKGAGERCRYLGADCRCTIHDELAARGLRGCAIYDCHGAGQRITRAYAGRPVLERNEAFLVLRVLHEWLWLITEAARRSVDARLVAELSHHAEVLDALAEGPLLELELGPHHQATYALLRRVGAELSARGATARWRRDP